MLRELIDQLFGIFWELAKFVWKLLVVTFVIIVLDWLLSFWGIRVAP